MYLLRGNMPRGSDPVGLNRDPSRVGRYLDGMWTNALGGWGRVSRNGVPRRRRRWRRAGYAVAAACSAAFCMNVIQASLDWDSAPGSGAISMPAASAGVRSPMPACGLKKLW